ncbi:hypothetical protein CGJ49_18405, partial [Vibrio parahaemolyticus]
TRKCRKLCWKDRNGTGEDRKNPSRIKLKIEFILLNCNNFYWISPVRVLFFPVRHIKEFL